MNDFYCEEVLSGKTSIKKIQETETVLAFYHTKPYWPIHIVVIPKQHVSSLLSLTDKNNQLLIDLFTVIREMAGKVTSEHGACRVLTNVGEYQDSKHLHFHICHGNSNKL